MRASSAAFLVCCMVILLSCSADQKDHTALLREGQYLFGVWNTYSEEVATKLIDQMTQTGAQEREQIPSLPIETSLKPADLLPVNGDVTDWVRSRDPSGYTAKDLYKDTLGGQPELYQAYGVIEQAEVEYQTPLLGSYPLIRVEIFDMRTPENAFGIYSFNRKRNPSGLAIEQSFPVNSYGFGKESILLRLKGTNLPPRLRRGWLN